MRLLIVEKQRPSDSRLPARLREAARGAGLRRVELVEEELPQLGLHAADGMPDLVFIGPSCAAELTDAVLRIRAVYPGVRQALVLENKVYAEKAVELSRSVRVRAIAAADLAQMAQLIGEAANAENGSGSRSTVSRGGAVLFLALKGGAGSTTVCQAFAGSWSASGLSVVLADFDALNPQLTDWAAVSGEKRRMVGELLRGGLTSSAQLQDAVLPANQSGLGIALCGAPELYAEAFHLQADVLEGAPSSERYVDALFAALQDRYDVTAIDAGRLWGVSTFAALRRADAVVLVVDDDRTTLARSTSLLQRLWRESEDPAEFDFSRWSIVLNAVTGATLSPDAVYAEFKRSKLFPDSLQVFAVPYSSSARDWFADGGDFYQSAEAEVSDAVDAAARRVIAAINPTLRPQRAEPPPSVLQSLRTFIGL